MKRKKRPAKHSAPDREVRESELRSNIERTRGQKNMASPQTLAHDLEKIKKELLYR